MPSASSDGPASMDTMGVAIDGAVVPKVARSEAVGAPPTAQPPTRPTAATRTAMSLIGRLPWTFKRTLRDLSVAESALRPVWRWPSAVRRDDLAGPIMTRTGRVAGVRCHDDDPDDVPSQFGAGLRHRTRDDHAHVARQWPVRRRRTVARVGRPGAAADRWVRAQGGSEPFHRWRGDAARQRVQGVPTGAPEADHRRGCRRGRR